MSEVCGNHAQTGREMKGSLSHSLPICWPKQGHPQLDTAEDAKKPKRGPCHSLSQCLLSCC